MRIFCSDILIMMMIVACMGGKNEILFRSYFFWKLWKIRSMSFTMSRWCICCVCRTKSRLYLGEQLFLYDLTIRIMAALNFLWQGLGFSIAWWQLCLVFNVTCIDFTIETIKTRWDTLFLITYYLILDTFKLCV